jgi:hypothetical protein
VSGVASLSWYANSPEFDPYAVADLGAITRIEIEKFSNTTVAIAAERAVIAKKRPPFNRNSGGPGRKKLWPERMGLKLAKGTFDRIGTILKKGEKRMDFVRNAVLRELKEREAQQSRAPRKKKK